MMSQSKGYDEAEDTKPQKIRVEWEMFKGCMFWIGLVSTPIYIVWLVNYLKG